VKWFVARPFGAWNGNLYAWKLYKDLKNHLRNGLPLDLLVPRTETYTPKVVWRLEEPLASAILPLGLLGPKMGSYTPKVVQVAKSSLAAESNVFDLFSFTPSLFFCVMYLTALGDLLVQLPMYLWALAIPNKIKSPRSSTKHSFFICFAVHNLYSCGSGVVQRFLFEWTVYTLIWDSSFLNVWTV